MRHSLIPVLALLGATALLQGACTLQYVGGGTPLPRYPKASSIQDRAYRQIDRIEACVRQRELDEDIADALADNDDLVLELTYHYQNSFSPPRDLTRSEWSSLGLMLDENELLLEDALRRRKAWRWFFNRGFVSYPASLADRRVYGVYLHYQVKVQYYRIQEWERSGRLSPAAARQLRERVTLIRNRRLEVLRHSQGLSLGREEALRLDRMVKDNSNLLKARGEGSEREWKQDKSGDWEDRKPTKYFSEDRWRNDEHRPNRGLKKGWKGLEDEDVPAPTPIPALRPTATPLPDLREVDEEEKKWDRPRRERRGWDEEGPSKNPKKDEREQPVLEPTVAPATPTREADLERPKEKVRDRGLKREERKLDRQDEGDGEAGESKGRGKDRGKGRGKDKAKLQKTQTPEASPTDEPGEEEEGQDREKRRGGGEQ